MFDLVAPNGPLTQEPADVYHSRRGEFLTSHRLAEFRRCPRHFRNLELGLAVVEADLLDHAARDNREAMYRLERCRISDQWTTGFERPRVIDLATFQGAA